MKYYYTTEKAEAAAKAAKAIEALVRAIDEAEDSKTVRLLMEVISMSYKDIEIAASSAEHDLRDDEADRRLAQETTEEATENILEW